MKLPEHMDYVDHGQGGGCEVLVLRAGARPQPAAGEILIAVAYAGVNRPDVLQRSGLYPPPAGASPVLGLEVSGTVVALGSEVTQWQLGDQVMALAPGGGYAQYCVVPAAHALPLPDGMSLAAAAAVPETWFTVWANLCQLGNLKRGETLLVHGGASGIGLTALQLAGHLGVSCHVTVGSPEKAEFCRQFGAAAAIDHHQEDFFTRVRELTDQAGVDVILDMLGGADLARNIRLLRREGRLLLIAFLNGSKAEVDFMPVMMKRLTITGSTMRARSLQDKARIRDELWREIWPAWSRGELQPHVCACFPLVEAAKAHRLMESRQHMGKIVLEVVGA